MLHSASQQGVIDHEEKAIHNNLFSFADQTAKSLLTHRSQIELVDLSDSQETILQKTQESSHSRFLVVDGSIDQIVGIFRTRDLVEIAHKSDFDIRSITSEPILVGESTLKRKNSILQLLLMNMVEHHELSHSMILSKSSSVIFLMKTNLIDDQILSSGKADDISYLDLHRSMRLINFLKLML